MAGPRTLGGWVVVNHGIRQWWHIQRALLVWGLCRELAGEPVNMRRVSDSAPNAATFYRDLQVYREVFPDVELGELWERIRDGVAARKVSKGVVFDAVLSAPVPKGLVA